MNTTSSTTQPQADVSPLFRLGTIASTPGALRLLEQYGIRPEQLLSRHVRGDWGALPPSDAQANRKALARGLRLLSSYPVAPDAKGIKAERVWVITEADRSVTTLLLPSEY